TKFFSVKMVDIEEDSQLGLESEEEYEELSDGELQEAFAKGLLKPGLNIPLEEPKKAANNVEGLKKCLADFKKNLPWVERLDLTNKPVDDVLAKAEGRPSNDDVNPEDDFQREMYFISKAQATVLEMSKTDQHHQKIRKKLMQKQVAMENSEKAKKLREQRKFGKKVQVEVLQKRQKQKRDMMTAVKKYQRGMTDKLDFLEGDKEGKNGPASSKNRWAKEEGERDLSRV
uniref:EBNA1 binding protein 2 n=1 Tax=Astyanax mexicanus TaxID=7994 RepID=A0A3B1JN62_ASTMX